MIQSVLARPGATNPTNYFADACQPCGWEEPPYSKPGGSSEMKHCRVVKDQRNHSDGEKNDIRVEMLNRVRKMIPVLSVGT